MWLIAGPNGAGKSTFAPNLSSDVEEIIRPDELAFGLSPSAPEKAAIKSGRLAIKRIKSLLQEDRSFAIETTLSGRFHIEMAVRAKATGWYLGIVYIGLSSSNLAVKRVLFRQRRGGHSVPGADIRRRYSRSLENFAEIYPIADRVLVFDNSSARRPMKRVLEANRSRIVFVSRRLPKWLRTSLDIVLE